MTERDLPARVYAAVLLTAALVVLLLYWFTATYNIPLEAR